MSKNLVIVESPAKAKTIEKILGKDFQVTSCFGHIRDLEKAEMGIDINNEFKPKYIVSEEKKKVVKELKSMAKKADDVWLATDEDREGEAISWHLCEVLGLDPTKTKRIVFHEITKPAIKKAVENPRTVNLDLVNAQQARRILDRIVGFEISPILWRKISTKNNLSAGRVQSVAVKLLAEREREIQKFVPSSSYKVQAKFEAPGHTGKIQGFKAELAKKIIENKDAKAFLDSCKNADYEVIDVQVKPAKKSPSAPFTTSTLQQEASRKLGYSVSKTMLLAQRLYENGQITYMRTDAVNLSETAMDNIRAQVLNQFGDKYYYARVYKNKNESAQEAHEAIRPTEMSVKDVQDADQQKLYILIWNRTMASQMADAELEKTTATIEISTNKENLVARGEVIKFDGFLALYNESTDEEENENEDDENSMLPPLAKNQKIDFVEMLATERFTRPASRYTEASLVKKLEELGIGRPSTYAPTISTIQTRTYVVKEERPGVSRSYQFLKLKDNEIEEKTHSEITGAERNKLFPTDLGMLVTDFLNQHFTQIMDYAFTAKIEEEFDEIAEGDKEWHGMLKSFYNPFHTSVATALEKAERVSGERELGADPQSGKLITARMGRFGPMVQLGAQEEGSEEKPKYAKLRSGQSIETITLDEALELFRLPRELGLLEDKPVVVNIGRFGPYVQHDGAFYSLGKELDPYTVDFETAQNIVMTKREEKAKSTIKIFEKEKIKLLIGPYGPYIKQGLRNFKIPKELQEKAADLTIEEVQTMIEEGKKNPSKKRNFKKKN